MEDCRPMSTPMITNWKKLNSSESELVDPTMYRQLIGSLMYLVNMPENIFVLLSTLSVSLWWSLRECIGWKKNMCSATLRVRWIMAWTM
jgi:hypothetical protein